MRPKEIIWSIITVFFGIVLYMIASIEIMWGFIANYIFSYHNTYNPNITQNDIDLGLPMSYLGSLIGTMLAPTF